MLFGRSLHSQLLRKTPAGSAAPLRAYGKLEIASEFIEVGCDERPEASNYRNWVRDGWKRLELATSTRPLRVRDQRLVLSTDHGRVWIVARLWDSADRRSDQGHQRAYPFTLFVVVPAPSRRKALSSLMAFCEPIWSQIDAIRPQLLQTADRAACTAAVRAASITIPSESDVAAAQPGRAVEGRPLREWVETLFPDAGHPADLLLALARHDERTRRNRERMRPFWRLPLAAQWPAEGQIAIWLRWLETNCRRLDAFAAFVPDSPEPAGELLIVVEPARPDDFLAAAAEDGVVMRLAPALRTERDPADDGGILRRIARQLPENSTLGEFAAMRLPGR